MKEIIYNDSSEELENLAAKLIEKFIREILEKKEKIVFAIPGGRSVANIFKKLITKDIEWSRIHIFLIDERLVSIENKDSNFKLAKESFLEILIEKNLLPRENIHPFIYDETKKDLGIINYSNEIKKFNNKYDIILLSSGEDGHVASLYPNHHSIQNENETYISVNDSPKLPRGRMSSSKSLLKNASKCILLFFSDNKKIALQNYKNQNLKLSQCPAKIVDYIDEAYVLTNIKT